MTRLALAGVVTACAVAVQVLLILLWFLRRHMDRRAARRFPEIALDPYHTIAVAKSSPDDAIHEAAAAALMIAGLITISPEGLVTVTARGGDPAHTPQHPIEAALLEYFGRAEAPVALSRIPADDALHERRAAFLREQEERMPRSTQWKTDVIGLMSLLTVVPLSVFYAVLIGNPGDVPLGNVVDVLVTLVAFVLLWLMIVVPLGGAAIWLWPSRRYLFQEYCAGRPPYPAPEELGADRRKLLDASRSFRTPAELEAEARRQSIGHWDTGMDTY